MIQSTGTPCSSLKGYVAELLHTFVLRQADGK